MIGTLRTLLATALLTTMTVAIVPAAEAWTCQPAADGTATPVSTLAGTYYQVEYRNAGGLIVELWKERNGENGLQTSSGMSCTGLADLKVASHCVGFCPIVM